ncbi:MAG: T9SS type B sorting domain-containing protein, partial [Flavisolibacter sp.]
MKFLITAFSLILLQQLLYAQTPCTAPGQNPSTAFPVCGTSTFTQSSVPICGGKPMNAPGCSSGILSDVNPYWYKFTCFQAGTLAFKITPHTTSEDYDWQLFDITNRNPNDVYTDISLTVASNWSGEGGETGASAAGTNQFVCEGFGKPLWSKMPNLQAGHEYLLLVSHFTQTQSGYNLSFGGGSAVITDSTLPRFKYAEAACDGDLIRLKLNKKMRCNSITASGSEFYVTPGNIPVTGVTPVGCGTGFDTDSIEIQLGAVLAPGTYTLNIKDGTDANTILDYCAKGIATTEKTDFTVFPQTATPMDSMVAPACAPPSIRLIFDKPMLCNSVAADGSDFTITGPYPVNIASATARCSTGSTTSRFIDIIFTQPLYMGGTFTLTLKPGTDGNTVLNECGMPTPAGSTLSFVLKDTVSAGFTWQKLYGCTSDTINLFHNGAHGVNIWHWLMDDNFTSNLQNPQGIYQVFDNKQIQLAVSNGFCVDTSSQTIALDNGIKADFVSFEDNCPNEKVKFTGSALGNYIKQHTWSFGDGNSSTLQSPEHTYAPPFITTPFPVRYTVTDSIGCTASVQKTIKIYSSCYLAVPTAFTPNNDGLNDLLFPLNAIKAEDLDFRIFNRWGQLVFQTKNWKNGWNGKINGKEQGTGVYAWILRYTDRDTKEKRQMKGTTVL